MRKTVLAAAILGAALSTMAHDDTTLAAQRAPHGGQLRMAGPYHLELVLSQDTQAQTERPIVVYVTDHAEKAVATAGAQAHITLLAGGRKSTARLVPDGENRLRGSATYASASDLKAVITLAFPGQPAVQARFTPFAR